MAAKKDNLPAKPVVSKVPLPISDSALVIDLPDGQKLVIGKMSQGTVIEVATWRGVGRPDSRTNRMMFGMSTAEIEEDDASNEASTQAAMKPENLAIRIINYPIAVFRWLFNIQTVPTVKRNGTKRNKLIIEPTVSAKVGDSIGSTGEPTKSRNRQLDLIFKILLRTKVILFKLLSQAVTGIKNSKLLKKLGKKSNQKGGSISETQNLEIESWLASITSQATKDNAPVPAKAPKKRAQKK